MSVPLECPQGECLESLTAHDVAEDQLEEWERHLNQCTACRARLDGAAQWDDRLARLGRQVGDPTTAAADPHLARIREHLHGLMVLDGATPVAPEELFFLEPCDRPELLGTLGDYEVLEVIGQGGMGVVLKAFDPALHRLVAIKVLSPVLAGSPTARKRFTREARAAAAVSHDHIVTVYGVDEVNGLPFLVMQYVAGESLQARLERSAPLELAEVVRIGQQAAAGLAAAHARGLIHRDIKPANIVVVSGGVVSGEWPASPGVATPGLTTHHSPTESLTTHHAPLTIKITDFGLARMIDDVGLTQDGVVAGTPEYMAPEQAHGEPVDHRSDLFSLGGTLHALCTGYPPFRGATTLAVLRQVSDAHPRPIRELNPAMSGWLEEVILRLLAKDPAQRFGSASELASLLEGYLAHLREPATVPAPILPRLRNDGRMCLGSEPRARATSRVSGGLRWSALTLLAGLAFLFIGDDRAAHEKNGQMESVTYSLRAPLGDPLRLNGIDAERFMKADAEGLRVVIPVEREHHDALGVESPLLLKGDFEITVEYELFALTEKPPPSGVGVVMELLIDSPTVYSITVSRTKKPGGPEFGANMLVPTPNGKTQFKNHRSIPAKESTGKLRLVRTGANVSYQAADGGGSFRTITVSNVGTDDVVSVRVQCYTGWTKGSLDIRLANLEIRATQIPDKSAVLAGSGPANSLAPGAPAKAPRGALAMALVLGLVVTVSFLVVVGLWLRARQRRTAEPRLPEVDESARAAAAPTLSFSCTGCGKTVKAPAKLGGKKVRCPGCGQEIRVPALITE
jgi:serine/threonine protein kinase